jgi:hypothetical protein
MKMNSSNKFVLFILIGITVVFIGFKACQNISRYSPQVSFKMPPDYLGLFKEIALAKLVHNRSYLINGREPYTLLIYDNRFAILVYKVKERPNLPLKELITEARENHISFPDVGMRGLYFPFIALTYTLDSIALSRQIDVDLIGDSLRYTINNDSVCSVYSNLEKLYVYRGKQKKLDFTLTSTNWKNKRFPAEISFLRKNGGVYIFVITSLKEVSFIGGQLPSELLNIVNNN